MKKTDKISADILKQARAWYVRLANDQAGSEDWMAFTDWLEQSPAHVDAYDAVELALADIPIANPLEQTPPTPGDKPASVPANDSDPLPANVTRFPIQKRNRSAWLGRIVAVAAVLMAALVVVNRTDIFNPPAMAVQYATNIGEQRDVVLSDGTHLTLNTNTRLSVTMDKKSRQVRLESGEAFFKIAKDEKRPFRVLAMGTTITDIGTSFDVYAADKGLKIAVAEGIVEMTTPEQTVRLTQGMAAFRKRGSDHVRTDKVDTEAISTWRDGILVVEDMPLSVLVPELNRYFKNPIVITDEKTARLTFSGALNIKDESNMLDSLQALLPITTERKNKKIVLHTQD